MITEKHVEALTVAMAIAPGVYARNRMFDLFTLPGVQRAKTRAGIIRGLIPHLSRATTMTVASERDRGGEPVFVLRYSIAEIRLHRVVELSPTELSALRVLAARANLAAFAPEPSDRAVVDAALARLLELESSTRAPSPSWPPPPPRFPV
jgi:hypothetical protein